MPDPAQRRDLARKPEPGIRIRGDVRPQDLDRDRFAVFVQPQVDDAHPTLAQALEEAVWPHSAGFACGGIERHATTVRPMAPTVVVLEEEIRPVRSTFRHQPWM